MNDFFGKMIYYGNDHGLFIRWFIVLIAHWRRLAFSLSILSQKLVCSRCKQMPWRSQKFDNTNEPSYKIIMVMILVLSPLMIYYTNTRILFWESFISCLTCLDQKLNTIQWKLSTQWCPVASSTDRLSPPTPEIF